MVTDTSKSYRKFFLNVWGTYGAQVPKWGIKLIPLMSKWCSIRCWVDTGCTFGFKWNYVLKIFEITKTDIFDIKGIILIPYLGTFSSLWGPHKYLKRSGINFRYDLVVCATTWPQQYHITTIRLKIWFAFNFIQNFFESFCQIILFEINQ